mmetsp:Transcript_55492/g.66879  ORF Transcript_55492/g.66879 Transcript_55492/m.66879 type:complete len:1154 (-) Transcript_55492:95-3556(-)
MSPTGHGNSHSNPTTQAPPIDAHRPDSFARSLMVPPPSTSTLTPSGASLSSPRYALPPPVDLNPPPQRQRERECHPSPPEEPDPHVTFGPTLSMCNGTSSNNLNVNASPPPSEPEPDTHNTHTNGTDTVNPPQSETHTSSFSLSVSNANATAPTPPASISSTIAEFMMNHVDDEDVVNVDDDHGPHHRRDRDRDDDDGAGVIRANSEPDDDSHSTSKNANRSDSHSDHSAHRYDQNPLPDIAKLAARRKLIPRAPVSAPLPLPPPTPKVESTDLVTPRFSSSLLSFKAPPPIDTARSSRRSRAPRSTGGHHRVRRNRNAHDDDSYTTADASVSSAMPRMQGSMIEFKDAGVVHSALAAPSPMRESPDGLTTIHAQSVYDASRAAVVAVPKPSAFSLPTVTAAVTLAPSAPSLDEAHTVFNSHVSAISTVSPNVHTAGGDAASFSSAPTIALAPALSTPVSNNTHAAFHHSSHFESQSQPPQPSQQLPPFHTQYHEEQPQHPLPADVPSEPLPPPTSPYFEPAPHSNEAINTMKLRESNLEASGFDTTNRYIPLKKSGLMNTYDLKQRNSHLSQEGDGHGDGAFDVDTHSVAASFGDTDAPPSIKGSNSDLDPDDVHDDHHEDHHEDTHHHENNHDNGNDGIDDKEYEKMLLLQDDGEHSVAATFGDTDTNPPSVKGDLDEDLVDILADEAAELEAAAIEAEAAAMEVEAMEAEVAAMEAEDHALPVGWTEYLEPTLHRPYYVHESGTTTWDRPPPPPDEAPKQIIPETAQPEPVEPGRISRHGSIDDDWSLVEDTPAATVEPPTEELTNDRIQLETDDNDDNGDGTGSIMMTELKQERVDTVDTDDYDDHDYDTESTSLAANNDASNPPNDDASPYSVETEPTEAPAALSTADTLPPGWREVTEPGTGNSYFYHEALGITQWDRPEEPTIVATDLPEEAVVEAALDAEDESDANVEPYGAASADTEPVAAPTEAPLSTATVNSTTEAVNAGPTVPESILQPTESEPPVSELHAEPATDANGPEYDSHDEPPADAWATEEMVQAHGDMDHHNELELAFITVITPLVMKHDISSLQEVDVSERVRHALFEEPGGGSPTHSLCTACELMHHPRDDDIASRILRFDPTTQIAFLMGDYLGDIDCKWEGAVEQLTQME